MLAEIDGDSDISGESPRGSGGGGGASDEEDEDDGDEDPELLMELE